MTSINYLYTGNGGLNLFYVGAAYKLNKNISIGANANYLFGGLDRNQRIIFNDGESFHTSKTNRISAKGFYYQLGLMYDKDLNEKINLTLGFTVNNNAIISAKQTILSKTFDQSSFLDKFLYATKV